jgi:hypothetical protein
VFHGKFGHRANGVRHGFCVVFEPLKNGETTAASPGRALRVPRTVAFDNRLNGTEFREARGASRGNACLDSKNAVSLSLRFGLQSTGSFSLVRVKPRHQNLQQDGTSSGAHSIAPQLVCRTGWVSCQTFPEAEASEAEVYDVLLQLIADVLSPGNCAVECRFARLGVGERSRSFGRILARATRLSPPRAGGCTLTLGHVSRPFGRFRSRLSFLGKMCSWNTATPNQHRCPFARPIAHGSGGCCSR